MIIRNEVIVSAKYFLNPISPKRDRLFPSIEGFISCRQATFSSNHLYTDNRFIFCTSRIIETTPLFHDGRGI